MELEIGSTIGDYQVTGILGAGGMGKVYKVRNVISDRVEAMKILLPDLAASPELADRFLREIKVLAMLDHPNIAQLHTAVRAENQLLMVMEFVDGETMEHRLKQGRLPLPLALDYISQVLSALEFAHSRGVVHRDIKPANMMLTPAGTVKLMDFGIAKATADHKLTMTGMTVGSVYYMSPEQIQGATTLDGRADLYSVGITLYELVTGKRPFDGGSQYSIMAAHLQQAPPPPMSLDPTLPQALNDAILMAVAKDPNARFQSAGAFRNALLGVASMLQAPTAPAVAAAPPKAAAPAAQMAQAAPAPSGSKRWLWMSLGGVAAAAAIVAAIEFGPWKATRAAVPPATQSAAVTAPAPSPTPTAAESTPAETPTPTPAPVATPAPATPAPQRAATVEPPAHKPAPTATASARPVQQSAVQPTPVPPVTPPQQVQAPPPQVVAPPQTVPQTAAPAGPSRAEILAAREHIVKLQVRANSIRDSLSNLKQTMQASGMGLNAKFTQPEGLMNTYMKSAERAMSQADLPAAKDYADKAERQIEILEKLLNL